MGIILSNYKMLQALSDQETGSFERVEAKRKLSRFNLFAFFIHDPNKHLEFEQKLDEIFEELDYLSGPRFLFFCVINAPERWKSQVLDRGNNLKIFSSKERSIEGLSPSDYGSIEAISLASALQIKTEDLPVLVITNNLAFQGMQILQTGEEVLKKQVRELGLFANSWTQSYPFNLKNDERFLKAIQSSGRASEWKWFKKPLSFILTEELAAQGLVSDNDKYDAEKLRKELLSELFRRDRAKDPEQMDFDSTRVISALQSSSPPSIQTTEHAERGVFFDKLIDSTTTGRCSIPIPPGFDSDSKLILSQVKMLQSDFETRLQELDLPPDYSFLINPIGKAFEIEINLSVVQWMRQKLGIEMPRYFNKRKEPYNQYCITPDPVVVKSPTQVDLNKGRGQTWYAPGIGQSELAFKALIRRGVCLDEINIKILLSNWGIIRTYRNRGAHTEILNLDDFENVVASHNILESEKIFQDLVSLKEKLRSG